MGINDYDDLMLFAQLRREAVERGADTFEYQGQYYSVMLAGTIIQQHITGGNSDGID